MSQSNPTPSTPPSSQHPDQEGSWMPKPILQFYSKFPLIVLPAEPNSIVEKINEPTLWVKPTYEEESYGWASSDPSCLRIQLLCLLRDVQIQFRAWDHIDAAPEGTLPALQLPSGELLSSNEIRPWLEREHPLPEGTKSLNGMPSQEAHTTALAHSHLILSKIYPAYTTLQTPPTILQLPFPLPTTPIPLSSTVYNALPHWLRDLAGAETRLNDEWENKEKEGIEGVKGLAGLVREHVKDGQGWFLGASEPSPLDALIASHIYPMMTLPESMKLRQAVDDELELKAYVERIMEVAGRKVRGHVRR